ncbi:hypothetical protein VN12_18115 [Pirellula sp. SH-Sr6A]|uniref:hypothetical protein n=1 Tax=Pirellula sp. SH-Sr6A TaxID=1632865 RepID=UPI00078CD954|nr:hypothetical protein [Pirellula sp. SH-Sr6A]AMV34051.1 hypothetical protein VN12_18115 [Pirellula sp. SH-Sr6A]
MNAAEAKILSKLIPGFGSYASQQQRRDDDLALRRYLIDRLQGSKQILQRIALAFLKDANFARIQDSESLRTSIEHLQSRLRSASEGYAPLFSSKVVDEPKLKEILSIDEAIVGFIDKLDETLQAIEQGSSEFEAAKDLVDRAKQRFARRYEILDSKS